MDVATRHEKQPEYRRSWLVSSPSANSSSGIWARFCTKCGQHDRRETPKPMLRRRLLANILIIAALAGALVVGVQGAASADPTGCRHLVGGGDGNYYSRATCTTAAPGIYFRSWVHCKHVDPYGRVTYNYRYSRWDWQGTSTGWLWAYCDYADVYSSYNSAPGGVQVSY